MTLDMILKRESVHTYATRLIHFFPKAFLLVFSLQFCWLMYQIKTERKKKKRPDMIYLCAIKKNTTTTTTQKATT